MIKAQEVAFCTEKGYIILDVRTEDQYEEGFIEGAINVPLYQLIQGWQPFKVARRIGYAAFGVLKGTEPNPRFLEQVAEVADRDTGIVLCCSLGGDLKPPQAGVPGVQSRSLVAAYELVDDGYTCLKILSDGINGWRNAGRDLWVADEDASQSDSA